MQVLIDSGADVDLCAEGSYSPVYIACQEGYTSIVEKLLKAGADVNKESHKGGSPLYKACKRGHIKTIQFLLNNGANVNQCRKDGYSPLCIASLEGHYDVVKLLLEKEAKFDKNDTQGPNPLHLAAERKHCEIENLLRGSLKFNTKQEEDEGFEEIDNSSDPVVAICYPGTEDNLISINPKITKRKSTKEGVENLKFRTVEKVPINSVTYNDASWLEQIILRNPFKC